MAIAMIDAADAKTRDEKVVMTLPSRPCGSIRWQPRSVVHSVIDAGRPDDMARRDSSGRNAPRGHLLRPGPWATASGKTCHSFLYIENRVDRNARTRDLSGTAKQDKRSLRRRGTMTATGVARSALTGWVLAIIRAMRTEGIDTDAVLADIGMDPALLEGGYSRYSQSDVSKLWLKAVELTGDPDFGFKVAGEVRPATFHVLGYSMSCSSTL